MPAGLEVKKSPTGAGRGVFALRSFKKGEEIERCPMLVAEEGRGDDLESGAEGYVFGWGDGRTALALGFGSLYNHRYDSNATTTEVGDEIYINYMGTAREGVWFDVL